MTPLLGVNIDHVATLRQARGIGMPDIVAAAAACERAGAAGITVHLREDRRHIQDADVLALRRSLRTKLNLEMAAVDAITAFAVRVRPDDVCLVPEKRRELTTEGGLDVLAGGGRLQRTVHRLRTAGIRVSIFVDPDWRQVAAAARIGADCVELHTGAYANAPRSRRSAELGKLARAGLCAREHGLLLNAGHGLDYGTVGPVARLQGMHELNIGFSIIARAVFIGLERAVRDMRRAMRGS